jgi:hypothetical protein
MSAGTLNGGVLSLSKLIVGGTTFTGSGVLLGLLGDEATSVQTTAGVVDVSVGTAGQTQVITTASTMVLPPGVTSTGGTTVPTLWDNTSAYAVGDVVSVGSLADPTGTYICITAVPAPVSPAVNPAPETVSADWTPVAPLAGGVRSIVGGGASPTPAVGAVLFTSTGASGATTALTWTSSASGVELGGTVASTASGVSGLTGGGASPTPAVGAVAFTSTVASGATTALTWTSTAGGMELGGTVATGASSLPAVVQAGQKAWTATGTTDTLTLTALPAGTYICQLTWGMPTAPPAILTIPPPTAGSTTQAVVGSGSITAGSVYCYSVIQVA